MRLVYDSKIKGKFTGWNTEQIFELVNGSKWKQKKHKYTYKYKYRPTAKIWEDGSNYYIEVEDMDEMVEVIRTS